MSTDTWTDRRVITGWGLAAVLTAVVVTSVTVAVDRDGDRKDERMQQCLATDRTAVDCRLGVYGSVS